MRKEKVRTIGAKEGGGVHGEVLGAYLLVRNIDTPGLIMTLKYIKHEAVTNKLNGF